MHHNVYLTTPSWPLFYFRFTAATDDICSWSVYYSMHEARINIFHQGSISETLNRNKLPVPTKNNEVHRKVELYGQYAIKRLRYIKPRYM